MLPPRRIFREDPRNNWTGFRGAGQVHIEETSVGIETAIGQIVQMLVVRVPIALLCVAILRVVWRAGTRSPTLDHV
jgi:hypothetical protein